MPSKTKILLFRTHPDLIYSQRKLETRTIYIEIMSARPAKRPRVENVVPEDGEADVSSLNLQELLLIRRWGDAMERLKTHPEEASAAGDPSALALSCRHGAPFECVKEILKLCPLKVRHLVGSRGTPLHEAVVCEEVGPDVIELLLSADIQLGTSTPRATLMQDVDGYTPLHLLIRRRFQSHIIRTSEQGSYLMEILEMLVKSTPEATIVPDRGEYEEPPIVMALKANVYAPLLRPEDVSAAQIEQKINLMVKCMLQFYPAAASCGFNGYRGKYTALHSAVFHGRCAETIELLIDAEKRSPGADERAGLLANTQGEMPLHFCAMRGEPPRSVALIAAAAPEAVTMRDSSGLTPIHWLWIRFVSSLLALDEDCRNNLESISWKRRKEDASRTSDYTNFATLARGDFEQDLALVRRIDPSVDFLRMRHIPSAVVDTDEAMFWADRTVQILKQVRQRYSDARTAGGDTIMLTRVEAVSSFFWTKLVSMLKASWAANDELNDIEFSLVRSAFSSPCCPPPVATIIASMYPEEMSAADSQGRLALHHAARRAWHGWDWPHQDGTNENANAQVLHVESALFLKTAIMLSPADAAKSKDKDGHLPLHYAVETFIKACCSSGRSYSQVPISEIQELLGLFVQRNPESLYEVDPDTGLYPYLHAAAKATQTKQERGCTSFPDELATTLVFQLLRENPSLVASKRP